MTPRARAWWRLAWGVAWFFVILGMLWSMR
jgi:hypothetical protein